MIIDDETFSRLRAISLSTHRSGAEAEGREQLIRFLDQWPGVGPEVALVDALCARFGLYPYMSAQGETLPGVCEALALEFHSPAALGDLGFTFHAEQQRVYQRLMDGENVILSAPTSFGKSVIMDALIASQKWSNMVLIVPTLALIDETRRRLARFRSTYTVITHPHEAPGARNVVVMTQERFLEFGAIDVDFFMIDEFYKLGSGGRQDSRRTLLNLAWTRLSATGAQYYLIGPNIDQLDERVPSEHREQLYRTEFKTVAVDVIDRSQVEDQRTDVIRLVTAELDGSTLVFTGSPKKAVDLAIEIAEEVGTPVGGFAAQVAAWIAENYDPEWDIARALRNGVGIHSGPLPRGLQRIMVRLFNDGLIPTMVCTSTLIEGVNTAAKNVVIFRSESTVS